MNRKLILIASFLLYAGHAGAAENNPWAAYRYAPDALREMDLASDTDWTLSVDGGAPRPIKVPGGGWNSDQQEPRIDKNKDVKDHVIYERSIKLPDYKSGQVVKLLFGAVNHGAEVYINDKLVATHAGPMTPFEADITDVVKPGETCQLKIKAYHRRHYVKPDGCHVPTGFDYPLDRTRTLRSSKFSYGITKYVRLALYPEVYVKEVFIQPSVTHDNLQFDVWVCNASPEEKTVSLQAGLASWNKDAWKYPQMLPVDFKIGPKSVKKITVGPIPWGLGPKSYWWPNIPFDEKYQAKLHLLHLAIKERGNLLAEKTQRFGFCEYAEGPYYYTINGVRVNHVSDATAEAQMSSYDCYATSPAFLPPTGPKSGCPETWRRYLRAGMNINRIHQSTPTPYMMDAADEVGFMLIPETGIRGCEDQRWDDVNLPLAVEEMAILCRNHPSVVRYSLSNEWGTREELIDAIRKEDPTRPLVFEVNNSMVSKRIKGKDGGHAYVMCHYVPFPRPCREIWGLGEFEWSTDGMAAFADQGRDMRLNDVCYYAGWSWMNWWPNFLEGMDSEHHGWPENRHADRRDGVDGWGSHIIEYVQRSSHPYLVMDQANDALNRYNEKWPTTIATYRPGEEVVRKIEMFNDVLSGNKLTLRWELRWDSATGDVVASDTVKDIAVEPGFHVTQTIRFPVPDPGKDERKLYLVLESLKQDQVVYRDDRIYVNVSRTAVKTEVKFLGTDEQTQGNWKKKYGTEGYETIGKEIKLPGYAKVEWQGNVQVVKKATDDVRALEYFANPDSPQDRIAAQRAIAKQPMNVTLDVGDSEHNVAIYLMDWDNKKLKQTIEVRDFSSTVLDTQTVGDFAQGKYLIWKIRGKVVITITSDSAANTVISGIYFDPAQAVKP